MKPTDRNYEAMNAAAGYTSCPCCGYDTISSDATAPEMCSDCEEAGCEADGSEPACTADGECPYWVQLHQQDFSDAPFIPPASEPCGCLDNVEDVS